MTEHQSRGGYYTIVNPKLIEAAVLPKDPERTGFHLAELREISPTGAKLLIKSLPDVENECRISIASDRIEQPLVASAQLHWMWPNLAGDWLLGCGINPPLQEAAFKAFIDSGLLERRFARREPTRIPVQVQLQPQQPRLPAIVHDLSDGGVCLTMRWDPPAIRELCIFAGESANEVRIQLKVRWSTHVGPEYFVGCEIVRYADILKLRKLQFQDQDHAHESTRLASPPADRKLSATE